MMKNFIALLGVLLLAGCAEGPPITTTPDLTFANLQPISVNASSVDVIDDYKPPLRDPNIEHSFRLPTYTALERLLR